MRTLSCAAVRRRLSAYHDGELPIADQIAVVTHLKACSVCDADARRLRLIGQALRSATGGVDPRDEGLAVLQAAVIDRLRTEREQWWRARAERMLDDMHLFWIGLAATAATVACAVSLAVVFSFASAVRADSLAAVLNAMASPGSNENPVRLDARIHAPRVYPDQFMPAQLISVLDPESELITLAAVVTREGRVSELEVLGGNERDRAALIDLLQDVATTRFEPARFGNAPVAVNLVWLLARTTVKGKPQTS